MKSLTLFAMALALLVLGLIANASQETSTPYTGQVIDVHVHAYPADANGPVPNAICVGISANLKYDPSVPWPVFFSKLSGSPTCEKPIWGPVTDDAVRDETIAIMRKHNVRAVLSGSPEKVRGWQAAGPGLFIPGYGLDIKRDGVTPEQLAKEFQSGTFAVLAEVTNQYSGVMADDPEFADYWKVAAENDIPVGIHVGIGPPGSPMLYPKFKAQSPLALQEILSTYPGLRVYMIHMGYPFMEETKAMLYLYPQLHVDTGVLQAAVPREEYYAVLKDLVVAGFSDRILFGSDQMNWPGLIEEGINAINEAPFLTHEQKKAILHDNAVRFLRLEK